MKSEKKKRFSHIFFDQKLFSRIFSVTFLTKSLLLDSSSKDLVRNVKEKIPEKSFWSKKYEKISFIRFHFERKFCNPIKLVRANFDAPGTKIIILALSASRKSLLRKLQQRISIPDRLPLAPGNLHVPVDMTWQGFFLRNRKGAFFSSLKSMPKETLPFSTLLSLYCSVLGLFWTVKVLILRRKP